MAGVKRGRGKLGAREHVGSRPNSLPLPFRTPATQATEDDRTDTNLIAPSRMHFWRSKSTLGRIKSVFSVFRRKPSFRVPLTTTSAMFVYSIFHFVIQDFGGT